MAQQPDHLQFKTRLGSVDFYLTTDNGVALNVDGGKVRGLTKEQTMELAAWLVPNNHCLGNVVDKFLIDALTALSGAVCTPEKGYLEDGGLQQLLADIKTLKDVYLETDQDLQNMRDAKEAAEKKLSDFASANLGRQ